MIGEVLEFSGINFSAAAAQLLGISSQAIWDSLVDGERSAQVLAEPFTGQNGVKILELVAALAGRFTEHHV